jgi:hypothetical protein
MGATAESKKGGSKVSSGIEGGGVNNLIRSEAPIRLSGQSFWARPQERKVSECAIFLF